MIYVVGETKYYEFRGRINYDTPLQWLCKYEGQFKEGLKDGLGKEKILDGTIYEGGFKNNLKVDIDYVDSEKLDSKNVHR